MKIDTNQKTKNELTATQDEKWAYGLTNRNQQMERRGFAFVPEQSKPGTQKPHEADEGLIDDLDWIHPKTNTCYALIHSTNQKVLYFS